jgi:hypothetical protein
MGLCMEVGEEGYGMYWTGATGRVESGWGCVRWVYGWIMWHYL